MKGFAWCPLLGAFPAHPDFPWSSYSFPALRTASPLIAPLSSFPALPFPFTSAHDPVTASPLSPQADPVSTLSLCH